MGPVRSKRDLKSDNAAFSLTALAALNKLCSAGSASNVSFTLPGGATDLSLWRQRPGRLPDNLLFGLGAQTGKAGGVAVDHQVLLIQDQQRIGRFLEKRLVDRFTRRLIAASQAPAEETDSDEPRQPCQAMNHSLMQYLTVD